MKLTKSHLKQIIKEELRKVLIESRRKVPWDWQSPSSVATPPESSEAEIENENPAFKDPKWWSGGFYVGPGSAAYAASTGGGHKKNIPDMTPEDWERMAARDNIQTSGPAASEGHQGYSSKERTNDYKFNVKKILMYHSKNPGVWGLHKTLRRIAKLTFEHEAYAVPPRPCHGVLVMSQQCPRTPQSKKAYDKYQSNLARIDAHEASSAGQAIATKEKEHLGALNKRMREESPYNVQEAHRACQGFPKTPTDELGRSHYSKCVEDTYLSLIGKTRPRDAAWAKIAKVDCGTNRSMFYTAKEKRQVPNAETHPKLPFYPKKCADPQSHRFDDGYCWKTVCVDSEGRVISH